VSSQQTEGILNDDDSSLFCWIKFLCLLLRILVKRVFRKIQNDDVFERLKHVVESLSKLRKAEDEAQNNECM
jgi:hypothetical protein